jgi:hypothetical protein
MDYTDAYYTINGTFEVPYVDLTNVTNERIKIGKENECSICGEYYKYNKGLRHLEENLYEIRILTEHPSCTRLVKKLEKLKSEVVDCEFELFCKRFSYCKYNLRKST